MEIIKVENLCKDYLTYKRGSSLRETVKSFFHREKVIVNAVKKISFSVNEGSITGILGPNGAGKSTVIKMLTGTLFPTSGHIVSMNRNPFKDRRKYTVEIGAVFGQKSQLIWDIPPVDSFMMNKAIYGIKNEEYKKSSNALIELFEADEIIKRPTRVLSLGERMKCEFIMSMLHSPKIVFLDEPTIGLDIIAKEKIRYFIKEMNKRGVTFILTTHDLEDVEKLVDNVIIINHGEKVFDSTLHDLKNNMGNKKLVHVIIDTPADEIKGRGISLIRKESDYEFELEIDNEQTDINGFISDISASGKIKDISIKELPIEKIIKELY